MLPQSLRNAGTATLDLCYLCDGRERARAVAEMVLSRKALATSFALHALVITLMIAAIGVLDLPVRPQHLNINSIVPLTPTLLFRPAFARRNPGGGGGPRATLPASLGDIPKPLTKIFAPPTLSPKPAMLMLEAGLMLPGATTDVTRFGDPFGVPGPPSGGTGTGGIHGDGHGAPVGPGEGGADTGPGSGLRGRLRGASTQPVLLYRVEPDYSDEARRARLQGTVVLWVVVGADGRPHDIRVTQSLGLGLDQKAVEAVRNWRFRPAMRDGKPVPVTASVEVNFRLL